MLILIAGGTGTSGRVLAERASGAGHHVRVLTRRTVPTTRLGLQRVRADVTTGEGLAEAMNGVDAVVDLTKWVTPSLGSRSSTTSPRSRWNGSGSARWWLPHLCTPSPYT